ncbi:PREDICTED: uncharacterized protein LOC106815854 [Priapulus caudatus]|uniref:Uncharacterized protein LOC106815854 n=1 Tax=Priapulus caudatus TaxID=37621 RepID=A0ABM1EUJ4_PRICU|nr:PREDICTED: uncharacterized protein LOC106815854 [Priapulus caudatus]
MGDARPFDGRPLLELQIGQGNLEVVPSFCYLGDTLSAGGGCQLATIIRAKTAWGKFRKLLPVLTSRHLSLRTRGHVYGTCVRSAMLHGSKTWAVKSVDLQRLRGNDRAMIRWICNVTIGDLAPSNELLGRLGILDLDVVLRERRLRWYGHVQCSTGAIKIVGEVRVVGVRRRGRPKMSWKEVVTKDREQWNLSAVDPLDRVTWRASVRAAQTGPSQIPGVGFY